MRDRTGKPLNIGDNIYGIDIPEKDIKCIPFSIIETGIEALDTQNIHIINFIEKYNDISLFSKSIIGKCDKPLLNRTFSKDEINKIALSENTLKKIIDTFEKQKKITMKTNVAKATACTVKNYTITNVNKIHLKN